MTNMEPNVLIIDDDKAIRYFISEYLINAGYEVKEAQDGEEGIDLLKNDDKFKVVITDIRMPKKDGNEVAKYIRNSYKSKDIPVFLLTNGLEFELFKIFKWSEVDPNHLIPFEVIRKDELVQNDTILNYYIGKSELKALSSLTKSTFIKVS